MKPSEKLSLILGQKLGESRIIDDPDILDQYSKDKSHCLPSMPDLGIRVKTEDEIKTVINEAVKLDVPIVARGAGTGKSGGAIPVSGGIIIDTSTMTDILKIDRDNLIAVVEPGIITGEFQKAVEAEGLFYPPDPNSLETCTIGGNLAHNAGGPRAFKYGVTTNYVLGTRTVLPNGEVIKTGKITVKGVTGYDITSLLVGSEGTLGIFSAATLRLIRKPIEISTLLILMPDEQSAGIAISKIVAAGLVPRVLEFMDSSVTKVLASKGINGIKSNTGSIILAEVDGTDEDFVEQDVLRLGEICDNAGAIDILMARHGSEREKLWAARRLMSDAMAETAKFKISEDIVVPRSEISKLLKGLKDLSKQYGVNVASYGHAGDGNFHVNVLWNEEDFKPEKIIGDIFNLTLQLGGTITGEHGVGISKQAYITREQSPALIAIQKELKKTFDPKNLMNPGKIFP
ncbi:MAG: FAD-binding protein [Deltaproteobacteria bacterium]|nr:FAD-binding protein [Deltaproteobacteria bacterium]